MRFDLINLARAAHDGDYGPVEQQMENWWVSKEPKPSLEALLKSIFADPSKLIIAQAAAHLAAEFGDVDAIEALGRSELPAIRESLQMAHPADGRTPKERAWLWGHEPVVLALERHEHRALNPAAANEPPQASGHYLDVVNREGAASTTARAGAGSASARRGRAPEL